MKALKWKWAKDSWNGQDKVIHFWVSMILTFILPWYVVLLLGFFKEVHDALIPNGSGFSYKDLTADIIGIFMGVLFVI